MPSNISFTSEDLVILAGHKKASIRYVAQVMLNERVMKSVSDEIDETKKSTS